MTVTSRHQPVLAPRISVRLTLTSPHLVSVAAPLEAVVAALYNRVHLSSRSTLIAVGPLEPGAHRPSPAMGVELSTARWIAPLSFAYDFAAQQVGMFSKPNMADVHDQNLSFWSPQPFFIAGFFFPQQIFQLVWLYRLWRLDGKKPKDAEELKPMVNFAPYYALGNVCIGTW